jgi:hypothetical protein
MVVTYLLHCCYKAARQAAKQAARAGSKGRQQGRHGHLRHGRGDARQPPCSDLEEKHVNMNIIYEIEKLVSKYAEKN